MKKEPAVSIVPTLFFIALLQRTNVNYQITKAFAFKHEFLTSCRLYLFSFCIYMWTHWCIFLHRIKFSNVNLDLLCTLHFAQCNECVILSTHTLWGRRNKKNVNIAWQIFFVCFLLSESRNRNCNVHFFGFLLCIITRIAASKIIFFNAFFLKIKGHHFVCLAGYKPAGLLLDN